MLPNRLEKKAKISIDLSILLVIDSVLEISTF